MIECKVWLCESPKHSPPLQVTILFVLNFLLNDFWAVPSWQYDFVKYDFFQTLSVIGGLLMVVSLGAGDLSVDERKKQY